MLPSLPPLKFEREIMSYILEITSPGNSVLMQYHPRTTITDPTDLAAKGPGRRGRGGVGRGGGRRDPIMDPIAQLSPSPSPVPVPVPAVG